MVKVFHNKHRFATYFFVGFLLIGGMSCNSQEILPTSEATFYFGADLSYINQVEDQGGTFLDENGNSADPFQLLATSGTNLARFRLWHNPQWTKEVYSPESSKLYSDEEDVIASMLRAKDQEMELLLDFHYSDFWADPGRQEIPSAWQMITDLQSLADSVKAYTSTTLIDMKAMGISPRYIQLGNEVNCGLLFTDRPIGFPNCNVCESNWSQAGVILNAAILAVREVFPDSHIILHIANPVHVEWWFENIMTEGDVADFDIIGVSYYPLWHNELSVTEIGNIFTEIKTKFEKDVMILETAYPWTASDADTYRNVLGGTPLPDFPFTEQGQLDFMTFLTQQLMDAGALGVIYWEPGWISSDLKDPWGQGSSWDNATFFDFDGRTLSVIDFPIFPYRTQP